MAQVSARYWLGTLDTIPREAAEQLVARLSWRGISGWPRASDLPAEAASFRGDDPAGPGLPERSDIGQAAVPRGSDPPYPPGPGRSKGNDTGQAAVPRGSDPPYPPGPGRSKGNDTGQAESHAQGEESGGS
jgi:hypothetical protein